MGFALEVECNGAAHESGLLPPLRVQCRPSGGMYVGGSLHHRVAHGAGNQRNHRCLDGMNLDAPVSRVTEIANAAHAVRDGVLVLSHIGPID